MWEFFEHKTVCLPLSPALEVCGLDTQVSNTSLDV